VLPQLEELERRFPDTLVIIGVHSAKFTAEMDSANLRQAVLRYDIRHPVVSDPDHIIWGQYAVSAWPTLVFVDPDGKYIGSHAGEFDPDAFAEIINHIIEAFDREGKMNRTPFKLALEHEKEPVRPLNFPGKILADAPSGRICIADTGHDRIVVTDMNGQVREVIGKGYPGMDDGDFSTATFWFPCGMALDGDYLYVADTWNHAIRRIDLTLRRVERVAGTGSQARHSRRGGPALETDLSSPWDLAFGDGKLYIAMAGTHQIWRYDPAVNEVIRYIGTGREALDDGTLERCALAQPSGLSLADGRLYFADSESSAVRVADIPADRVETIVGQGLFDFGDRDGLGRDVLLQHDLGVAYHDGWVYVADTYNNKIKAVDPATKLTRTFLGTGDAGLHDGPGLEAKFWEPGGLSISGGTIYIADTNNHAIRAVDIGTGNVRTIAVFGG
jgi:DNA-binding beta-propeller fold protein YncE